MKKQGSKRRERKAVGISEMNSSTLYVKMTGDRILHRRLNNKLEKLVGNKWVEVKVTKELLMNEKFREY